MKTLQACLGLPLILAALGGCGSGAEMPDCIMLGGGAAQVNAEPATAGSIDDAPAAFDGILGTAASVRTPAGTGVSRIRGTMQPGQVEPAGTRPGFVFRGNISSNVRVKITTLLQGSIQESGPALSTSYSDGYSFFGRAVARPYDAIEVELDLTGDSPVIEVFELCRAGW